ncbi:MAG: hypothetical protein GC168_01395 [Candidatus Hydrogenedens sp.]|nr:hypothetical protein [Candidatus Hydrogenedens sp.]
MAAVYTTRTPWRTAAAAFAALALLAAGLFGLGGSGLLLVLGLVRTDFDAAANSLGLLMRVVLFGGLIFASTFSLWRLRDAGQAIEPRRRQWGGRDQAALALVLALAALASFPNQNEYPYAAPDETHHLLVARNLSVYGAYASGHPKTGLNYFDAYDSVGPTVIAPAALSFRVFGVSLAAGRAVVSLYFLGLLALIYAWIRRHAGTGPAFAAALGVLMAYSSFYLSRTFYGEVPALFFLVAGLMLWERAESLRAHLLAGLLLGCCVLSKPIFLIAACCGVVALLFAWMRGDRMRWGGLACMAAGIASPVVAWSVVQSLGESESRSMLGIYQHYLLFGIAPIAANLTRLAGNAPMGNLLYPLLVLVGGAVLVQRRASPALLTLWLAAPFFAQWWLAYTPGQLPRYLWPCYLVAGIAWGVAVARLQRRVRRDSTKRLAAAAALVLLCLTPAAWLSVQVPELAANRELRPTQAVAGWLNAQPQDTRIATTDYMLRGALSLLSGKAVGGDADAEALQREYDFVVVPRATLGPEPEVVEVVGSFAILQGSPE